METPKSAKIPRETIFSLPPVTLSLSKDPPNTVILSEAKNLGWDGGNPVVPAKAGTSLPEALDPPESVAGCIHWCNEKK